MVTRDEFAARRQSRFAVMAKLRRAVPMVAGAAWVLSVAALFGWFAIIMPGHQGLHTPACLFTYPVALIVSFLPHLMAQLLFWPLLFGYYAVLTQVAWNARRSQRWFHLAVAMYGLHLASNFAGTLYTAYWYPSPAGYIRTWGDIGGLLELSRHAPVGVAMLGVLLLGWHVFVWWRLCEVGVAGNRPSGARNY